MRRIRSLKLLQKPPNCVAQLSGAVCVVPTAVREDDALGLPRHHRLDSRLQFMPVPPRKIQPQITLHAAVRRCDATDPLQQQQQQAVDLPGFRIRQQVGENERSARSATAAERERVRRRLVPGTHHRGDRRETPRLNDTIKTRQGAGRVDRAIKRKGAGSLEEKAEDMEQAEHDLLADLRRARLGGALRHRDRLRRSTLEAGYKHVFSDF